MAISQEYRTKETMEVYGTYSAAALSFSKEFQMHLEQKNLKNIESSVSIYPHIHACLMFGTACTRDKQRLLLGFDLFERNDPKTCK
jgi:hypothetical protein